MRITKYILPGMLFLFIIGLSIVILAKYLSFINTQGTINLTGLSGTVIIDRDQYGIPHIQANQSDADAFFALGFVHAQDRLWQMEFQRHVVQGRLSEIFGKDALDKDKFLRTWGFYRAAKLAWPALDATTKRLIHSYTQGINAFLAQGKLPLQFLLLGYKPQPWTDIDSIAWQKMMAFDLQTVWEDKINNYAIASTLGKKALSILTPPYPKTAPIITNSTPLKTASSTTHAIAAQPSSTLNNLTALTKSVMQIRAEIGLAAASSKGSNNWVVNGKLTATGKPLLASDPHLALAAPIVWYLAELRGPNLHVIGATIPGLPGIVIGHNDQIAWGVTNVNPNTQDLYIETSDTPLQTITETILVKNHPAVKLSIQISPHGPIINQVVTKQKFEQPLALKWTALLPNDTTIQSILKINYAKNWQTFTKALQDFVTPSQNFVYADVAGNIGYYLPGLIPIRNGWDNRFPIDANLQQEWQGYIPFKQLPHSYNPTAGYIASANNKVTNDQYPYLIAMRWKEPPYRAQRITDLLTSIKPLTIASFEKIQTDNISYLWQDLRPFLLATKPLDKASEQALQELTVWDGATNVNSKAATFFAYWYQELTLMLNQQLPFISAWTEPLFIKQQLRDNGRFCQIASQHNCTTFLSQSLQRALHTITQQLGSNANAWRWGNIHKANFIELGLGQNKILGLLINSSLATPGGEYTVNYGHFNSQTMNQTHGAGYRQIIDLSNFNNSRYMIALGQSGNFFSKHRNDLLPLWRDGKYLPMSSLPKDWGKTSRLLLKPAVK